MWFSLTETIVELTCSFFFFSPKLDFILIKHTKILLKQCGKINYIRNISELYVIKIFLYVYFLNLVFISWWKITSVVYWILEHPGKSGRHFMRLSLMLSTWSFNFSSCCHSPNVFYGNILQRNLFQKGNYKKSKTKTRDLDTGLQSNKTYEPCLEMAPWTCLCF